MGRGGGAFTVWWRALVVVSDGHSQAYQLATCALAQHGDYALGPGNHGLICEVRKRWNVVTYRW